MRVLTIRDINGKEVNLLELNSRMADRLWGNHAIKYIQRQKDRGENPFLFDWVQSFSNLGLEDLHEIYNVWSQREKEYTSFDEPYSGLKRLTFWLRFTGHTVHISHYPN